MLGMVLGAGIVLLLAVVSHGAVGGGDIKLMWMLGAALGWKGALAVLALSQVAAALVVLVLLITQRAGRHDLFPVGAIISLLGTVMLLGGP
jgi:leader peptidase (prepilin peptidase)/N-methyltransferase